MAIIPISRKRRRLQGRSRPARALVSPFTPYRQVPVPDPIEVLREVERDLRSMTIAFRASGDIRPLQDDYLRWRRRALDSLHLIAPTGDVRAFRDLPPSLELHSRHEAMSPFLTSCSGTLIALARDVERRPVAYGLKEEWRTAERRADIRLGDPAIRHARPARGPIAPMSLRSWLLLAAVLLGVFALGLRLGADPAVQPLLPNFLR